MTILQHSIAEAAAAATGYQIARSLRFNSADSAHLSRTPASAGNRQKWTWSGWVKRSALGAEQLLFHAYNGSNPVRTTITIKSTDQIEFTIADSGYDICTATPVYRDVGAYYHVCVGLDSTQATAANRLSIEINGVSVAYSSSVTQNRNGDVNTTNAHHIGSYGGGSYLNGYLANVHFVDGQKLAASNFAETDANTGVWVPKAYTGTYGTNGFWLKFDDNSGVTATTLGKDSSGNGNNWTPNNFSVTAGVGNDSLVDSPTNYGTDTGAGGEVRGNYCTWNGTSPSGATFSNGNLDVTAANNGVITPSTFFPSSGKWYCEVLLVSGASPRAGITTQAGLSNNLGNTTESWANLFDGRLYYNATVTNYGVTLATGDILMMALDIDAGKIWYGKNGTWMASGSPSTGANPSQTFTANLSLSFAVSSGGGTPAFTGNFGQRPFAYTAPSGFKALCTTNLPTPAIGASASTLASKNFNVVTWTGANAAANVTVSGVGFQPDFVWSKSRSNAYSHPWYDAVRGVGKALFSNVTDAELTNDASGYISAFNSDGFTASVGATNNNYFNQLNVTYVAWNWKANGAGSSNTAGTITSTVSANQTAGISVVTYTANGVNGATVGHGLGKAPSFITVKQRDGADSWYTYTNATGNNQALILNSTGAAQSSSAYWNNTSPTSSVFSLGSAGGVNTNTKTYVAYCFAEIEGFSKIGSYTGNGSTDGPFVYCGFRPRWILVKLSSGGTDNWMIYDAVRSTFNDASLYLQPSSSNSEGDITDGIDILSNGFKIRGTNSTMNTNSWSYIFMAFAESPFNYARAR